MTNEEYYQNTGILAKRAVRRKVLRGGYPGCAPLGYKNEVIAGKHVIVPDAEKAPLVREAFALHAQGRTLQQIIAELTPKGLVSRNGKPLGVSSLHLILHNPVYRGYVSYEDLLIAGNHIPLIGESKRALREEYGSSHDPRFATLSSTTNGPQCSLGFTKSNP